MKLKIAYNKTATSNFSVFNGEDTIAYTRTKKTAIYLRDVLTKRLLFNGNSERAVMINFGVLRSIIGEKNNYYVEQVAENTFDVKEKDNIVACFETKELADETCEVLNAKSVCKKSREVVLIDANIFSLLIHIKKDA